MQYRSIAIIGAVVLSLLIVSISVAMPKTQGIYQVPYNTIKYHQLSKDTKKQIDCLAKNMYHEAAYEPKEGWIAVAMVTLNRVKSGNYASSVCDVVYQKTGRTYQFSWVGLKNKLSKVNYTIYEDILELATLLYVNRDRVQDNTGGATFYHANYVNPNWKGLQKTKQIGQHIFYKSPQDI